MPACYVTLLQLPRLAPISSVLLHSRDCPAHDSATPAQLPRGLSPTFDRRLRTRPVSECVRNFIVYNNSLYSSRIPPLWAAQHGGDQYAGGS